MKQGIHPENYRVVAFKDMSNDDVFLTKSTVETKETIEHEGTEYNHDLQEHKEWVKAKFEAGWYSDTFLM